MPERFSLKVLGKIIGTSTGWDQNDTTNFIFYDYQPNDIGREFLLLEGDLPPISILDIDCQTGLVSLIYEDGIPCKAEVDWSVFNK